MSELEKSFLASIKAGEDSAALIYSDWLEEQGRDREAEIWRRKGIRGGGPVNSNQYTYQVGQRHKYLYHCYTGDDICAAAQHIKEYCLTDYELACLVEMFAERTAQRRAQGTEEQQQHWRNVKYQAKHRKMRAESRDIADVLDKLKDE